MPSLSFVRSATPLCLALSILLPTANALNLPVEIIVPDSPFPRSFPSSHQGRQAGSTSSNIPLYNNANAQYVSNITIAGTTVRVLLDTGSSDLWVSFPSSVPSDLKDSGESVSLSYAIGAVTGNVHMATMTLGSFTVEEQAFILVEDASGFSTDIHAQGYDGLLGLGPNEGSEIMDEIDSPQGDSILQRIFSQPRESKNFITVLLDRKADPTDPFAGQFTIAEVVDTFSDITSTPRLNVAEVYALLDSQQHWQILTDQGAGLIGPDGNVIASDSIVPKAPDGHMVAVLDSGFTLSQVPREVSDAIYGRVKGAKYNVEEEIWTVPCGQLLNVTFSFGGQKFPIHPLDVVDDNFNTKDENGNKVCLGSFQPITTAFSIFGNFDMILGMNFLRNAYSLYDFGDWIDGGSQRDSPYIQLLPLTNAEQARDEFYEVRHGGNDPFGDSQYYLLPVEEMQHSPVSDEEKKKKMQEKILSRWPYILAACLGVLVLVLAFCIWRCCCRKKVRKGSKAAGDSIPPYEFAQGKNGHGSHSSYVPLQTPVAGHSSAHLPSHSTSGGNNSRYGSSHLGYGY